MRSLNGMKKIVFDPIGIIRTPYKYPNKIPIQARFGAEIEGSCILQEKYEEGMKDLDGFSHAILIYHFHKAKETKLVGKPFLETSKHGIFAIRSPNRPNKLGFSIVRIKRIIKNQLVFTGVDMLDGTPLLDIKPFVEHFDSRKNVKSGWIDKHFENGTLPDETILK